MRTYSARAIPMLVLSAVLLLGIFYAPAPPTVLAGEAIRVGSATFGVAGQYVTWNTTNITYTVDGGNLGMLNNATAVGQVVDAMFQKWEDVATSNISFTNGGSIPSVTGCTGMNETDFTDGDVSTIGEFNCLSANGFSSNPIVFDVDGSLTEAIFGAGASNGVLGFAGPLTSGNAGSANHVNGRAVLNGKFIDGCDTLVNPGCDAGTNFEDTLENIQATALHEFGHMIGLGHSQINVSCFQNIGSCGNFTDPTFGIPTMFPVSFGLLESAPQNPPELTLSEDDIAWISLLYAETTNNPPTQIPFTSRYGTISGQLLASDGLSAIQGGNVIARQANDLATAGVDESLRCAVSIVSGELHTVRRGQNVTSPPVAPSLRGSSNGALYGAYGIPVPVTPTDSVCAAAATAGMYELSAETIHNDTLNQPFVGGSSVGPHGRELGVIYPLPGTSPAPVAATVTANTTTVANITLVGTPATNDASEGASRNDAVGNAAPVGNGTLLARSISPTMPAGPDTDFYSFTAIANTPVTFDLNAEATYNTFLDTVIEIVDVTGTRVNMCGAPAFTSACLNDDDPGGGGTVDSFLEFRSPSAGVFFLHVLDFLGDARVDYRYDLVVSGAGTPPSGPGCTKDFTGAVDSNWLTGGNWTPSGVPGTSDGVCIGAFTVSLGSSTTIDRISGLTGTLNVTGGTLTARSSILVNGGTLRLNGGSVSVDNAGVFGPLNLTSGLIEGTGSLSADPVNQTGGTIGPGLSPGVLNLDGGDFTQSASGTVVLEIAGTGGAGAANGHDQVNVTNGGAIVDGTFAIVLINGFVPNIGDSFTIATANGGGSGNNTLDFSGAPLPAGRAWTDATSTGTALIVSVIAAATTKDFDNDGGDSLWENPLNWTGDTLPTNTDNAHIGSGFTVTKSGAGGDTVASLTIDDGAGVFTLSSNLDIAGTSTIGNGGFTLNTGGTLTGAGDVSITGLFTWTGGTQSGAGVTTANGGITFSGASAKTLSGRTLTSTGAVVMSGTGNLSITNSATFNNNGSFDLQTDADIFLGGAAPHTFNNNGTFTKSGAGGVSSINPNFNNNGTVNVNSGTLDVRAFTCGGACNGAYNVAATATLVFSGAGPTELGATSTVAGAGTVNFNVTTVNHAGTHNVTGTTQISAVTTNFTGNVMSVGTLAVTTGTANFSSGEVISPVGTVTQSGGFLTGSDTITIAGMLNWSGGTQSGTGVTNANGGITFSGAGAKTLSGRTLTSPVTTVVSGTGAINIGSGAMFNNNGTFDLQTDASIGAVGGTPRTFNNNGTFTKSAGAASAVDVDFNNAGTMIAASGALTFSGVYAQTTGVTRLNGGSITKTGTALTIAGGLLEGSSGSTVTGNVNNTGGTIGPGLTPGTLNITGNYTQGAGGTLLIEIGGTTPGTQFDVVNITGSATLAGTLIVDPFMAFVPSGSFQIMTAVGGVSGDFTTKTNNTAGASFMAAPSGNNYVVSFAAAACNVNFDGGGGTDAWETAANWDTDTVPTAADNVCIDLDLFAVTVSTGAQAANSITVTGGVNPFAIIGGSLTLSSASSTTILNQNGGVLDGPGSLTITGMFTWLGGTHQGSGATNANGGMILGGTMSLNNGRALNNAGAATWSSGDIAIGNGAAFNNLATGTLDIQHGGTQFIGGGLGGSSFVMNTGTITQSNAVQTNVFAGFNNNMTLNVNSGVFNLNSGSNASTSTGAFNVGTTLSFAGGTYDLNAGANVSGAGTTAVTGGQVNFNNGSSLSTPVSLSSGQLTLLTGGAVTLPTLTQTGGTLTGTDTLNITGAFTWDGGAQEAAGTTNANGGMTLGTGAPKDLNNGRTLNNVAAAIWAAGDFRIGNGGTFNNFGTFDIQHAATQSLGGGLGGGSSITNIGTITQSNAVQTNVFAGFNNNGTLNVNSGTFALNSGANSSTSFGAFNVATTLQFDGGTHDLNFPAAVTGAGTTVMNGGTANFNLGSTLSTATVINSGTLNVISGAVASLPSLTQTGGTLGGTGTVNVNGTLAWSGGTMTGTGTTMSNAVLNITGNVNLDGGRTLNNDGVANWTAGNFNIGNGAMLTNTINGLFNIQTDANLGGGLGGASTVNNDGTVTKSAGGGITAVFAAFNNNAGAILNVNSGTMQFNTAFTQNGAGSVTSLAGGNLSGGITFNFNGGTLTAIDGSTITGNLVNAGAIVNPGTGPGTLNIIGNFVQGPAGVLNIELGGTAAGQFDVVAITGSATLDGTLNVLSFGGFMPGLSTFQVMTYASVTGDFAAKNGLNIATPPFSAIPQATFYLLTNNINSDLAVTKTDQVDPVNVGGTIIYTVTVTNGGPDPATGVVLTDTLPANTTFVSAMTTVGSCGAPVGQLLTCNIGNLANGASAVVTISLIADAGAPPSVTNNASVAGNENDPNAANNTVMETTTINPVADLAVTKTDAPDPVTQGQNVTYTITVTNNGPNDASNVSLTDVVPTGTTFVSFTAPAGWTSTTPAVGGTGTVTATNPSVANGAMEVFTLVVATTAGAVPSISNTATVAAAEVDSIGANNSATATTTVTPLTADLSVTKTDSPDPVDALQNVTYTITVTNAGPDPASNVSLTDVVPTGTTFVSFTAPAGWTFTTPAVGGTGTVTATNPSVAVGAPQVFTLVVATTGAAVPSISNTASVTAVENDPMPADNSATQTTTVNPVVDLSVTKVDAADPVLAGANIVYTVTVANAGPNNATGVTLTDTLPMNATFVSSMASQGTCNAPAGGAVVCNLGAINSGANATVTITLMTTAASVPTVSNMASVASTETDTNVADNTATETTTVNPAADVAVTKTGTATVNVGANITYTITVTNNGPSPATNVSLSDMLPAGTTFVSLMAPAGWTTTTPAVGAGGTVTATNVALAAATPQAFTLVVAAGPTAVPSVSNTATVAATEPDANAANNSATAMTTVNPVADLSITKTDSPDPVNQLSDITYTITVANAGPSPAANVTVTDNVPAGTSFVSATPSAGMCSPAAGVVTCNLGMLASGGNATITLIVNVTGFGPTITNTSTVSSSVTDPVAGNNSATATTTVNVTVANDFSISVSPSIQNAMPGSTATYTVTLTPIPAGSSFTNPIALACFVQPPLSTCSFSPQTVTPGASPANSTLSVVVPSFALAPPVRGPVNTAPPLTLWLLAASLALIAAGITGRRLARHNVALAVAGRRMAHCVTVGLVLLVISLGMAQSACVGANNHITGPYTVTVSGTAPGGISHSTTATVNVQR